MCTSINDSPHGPHEKEEVLVDKEQERETEIVEMQSLMMTKISVFSGGREGEICIWFVLVFFGRFSNKSLLHRQQEGHDRQRDYCRG